MYHIYKQTRMYQGESYCGCSSNYQPAEADTLEDAIALAQKMFDFNPVGWNIFDGTTGELVHGYNMFNIKAASRPEEVNDVRPEEIS